MDTGPLPTYTVAVRGVPKTFNGPVAAATYAAARILEGETDLAYAVSGFTEAVRHHRESKLIERIEELVAKGGSKL
jgi:hypothetical protein